MAPETQPPHSQPAQPKRATRVQRRKRVSALTPAERRQIVYLFDAWAGDADHVADRCGIVGVQRADVLAVVLAETRKGPQQSPALVLVGTRRAAA
jgi:hypothetical protein